MCHRRSLKHRRRHEWRKLAREDLDERHDDALIPRWQPSSIVVDGGRSHISNIDRDKNFGRSPAVAAETLCFLVNNTHVRTRSFTNRADEISSSGGAIDFLEEHRACVMCFLSNDAVG
jgi:hypothetical protein